jgi:geranylgeranyl pyrophosphate synthase
MKAMDRFADEIGIAYQIMDDILGIYADAGYLGKDVGSDIAEFKQTILWMYVRNNDPEATERLLRYYGRRQVSEEDLKAVRDIFRESGALSYAQSVMEGCFKRALRILSRMQFVSEEDRSILKGFVTWCSGRKN